MKNPGLLFALVGLVAAPPAAAYFLNVGGTSAKTAQTEPAETEAESTTSKAELTRVKKLVCADSNEPESRPAAEWQMQIKPGESQKSLSAIGGSGGRRTS